MKTFIVILILAIICFFSLRSFFKIFKEKKEDDCCGNCGKDQCEKKD